jgi:hypothetical protein
MFKSDRKNFFKFKESRAAYLRPNSDPSSAHLLAILRKIQQPKANKHSQTLNHSSIYQRSFRCPVSFLVAVLATTTSATPVGFEEASMSRFPPSSLEDVETAELMCKIPETFDNLSNER